MVEYKKGGMQVRKRGFTVDVKGRVKNFNIPQNQPLVPLYEAIVNSIHAIGERNKKYGSIDGEIKIYVERENQEIIDGSNVVNNIIGFTIEDNGVGFNEANYESFMTSDSEYKAEIGGKGVGRFSWLRVFQSAEVNSTFYDEVSEEYKKRVFDFTLDNEIEDILESNNLSNCGTIIKLRNMDENYKKNTPKGLDTITRDIIQHCLIYLLDENCPKITVSDSEDIINVNSRFQSYMEEQSNKVKFKIEEEVFELQHIKINERNYDGNKLLLCANDRLVETKNLEQYIADLDKDIYEYEGYWYIGIVTGKYLDENVDMNRLSFNIPEKESGINILNKVSINGLTNKVAEIVENHLDNYLHKISKEKLDKFKKYTNDIAPQYRHLFHYKLDDIKSLKPNISNINLDNELHNMKRDLERKSQSKSNEILELYKNNKINTEEYRELISEELEKITSSNSSTLAEYILHRKIIIDLLDATISKIEEDPYGYEKDIHDLIYPMKGDNDSMPYDLHNLWLIDDKLSYSHFISSDKAFKKSKKRPDLFFMDNPVAVADVENEGSEFNAITIFELKRPMRNDYTGADNPIKQTIDYVKILRNGKELDSKGRPIRISENTKFYLYIICDITSTLEPSISDFDFKTMPDGIGMYKYHEGYNAYIEILPYSKLNMDAKKRNKILFEKLGLKR